MQNIIEKLMRYNNHKATMDNYLMEVATFRIGGDKLHIDVFMTPQGSRCIARINNNTAHHVSGVDCVIRSVWEALHDTESPEVTKLRVLLCDKYPDLV